MMVIDFHNLFTVVFTVQGQVTKVQYEKAYIKHFSPIVRLDSLAVNTDKAEITSICSLFIDWNY